MVDGLDWSESVPLLAAARDCFGANPLHLAVELRDCGDEDCCVEWLVGTAQSIEHASLLLTTPAVPSGGPPVWPSVAPLLIRHNARRAAADAEASYAAYTGRLLQHAMAALQAATASTGSSAAVEAAASGVTGGELDAAPAERQPQPALLVAFDSAPGAVTEDHRALDDTFDHHQSTPVLIAPSPSASAPPQLHTSSGAIIAATAEAAEQLRTADLPPSSSSRAIGRKLKPMSPAAAAVAFLAADAGKLRAANAVAVEERALAQVSAEKAAAAREAERAAVEAASSRRHHDDPDAAIAAAAAVSAASRDAFLAAAEAAACAASAKATSAQAAAASRTPLSMAIASGERGLLAALLATAVAASPQFAEEEKGAQQPPPAGTTPDSRQRRLYVPPSDAAPLRCAARLGFPSALRALLAADQEKPFDQRAAALLDPDPVRFFLLPFRATPPMCFLPGHFLRLFASSTLRYHSIACTGCRCSSFIVLTPGLTCDS